MLETLADYIDYLNRRMFLPGLQREYVWTPKQIAKLFDSLIRGYPVGQVTLWRVGRQNEHTTYEFIEDYLAGTGRIPPSIRECDFTRYNSEVEVGRDCDFLVIDGQQRLNSAYIGLCGSIATYVGGRGRKRSNPEHWREQVLCINLFGSPEYVDADGLPLTGDYEFEFRATGRLAGTDGITHEVNSGCHKLWFPLSEFVDEDGLERGAAEVNEIAQEQLEQTELEATGKQRRVLESVVNHVVSEVRENVLGYKLDHTSASYSREDVHEVFTRINLEGSPPKPYQYVQSSLMAYCPYADENAFVPREELKSFLPSLIEKYPAFETGIDRKLITRYLVYLINEDLLRNTVEEFTQEDELRRLRDKWAAPDELGKAHSRFEKALDKAFETVDSLGFTKSTMPSMLPIALLGKFYYENPSVGVTDANKRATFRFLAKVTLLGSMSSSQARHMAKDLSRLGSARDLEVFPGDELIERRNQRLTREHIEEAVERASYAPSGDGTFTDKTLAAILGLLDEAYTEQNVGRLEVDHIFPVAREGEIANAVGDEIDIHRLGNLQLLEADVNQSKGAKTPKEWLVEVGPANAEKYERVNRYPQYPDPEIESYQEFAERREEFLVDVLTDKYVSRADVRAGGD